MKCVQRLNGEHMEWLIDVHRHFPNSFSDVWLSAAYGYPNLKKHRKLSEELSKSATLLRKNGIGVSLQLSNTIGHGQYMAAKDCSALQEELKEATRLVGHDGTVAEYAFCWRDEMFLAYVEEQLYWYVKNVNPEEVWLDDDLRANNHSPVQYGCFCEKCIEKFNGLYGYEYDREMLLKALEDGDLSVRQQWSLFVQEGLSIFVERICKKMVSIKADISIGLQNGPNGCYAGFGYDYLLEPIYRITGRPLMYRAGAGAYQDYNPNALIEKAYCLAYQYAILPEYVTAYYAEIENTPNTAMGKTMYGTAFEATLDLALGATDCCFAMLGVVPEEVEFYENGFKQFEKFAPYWKKLAGLSKQSCPGGVWFAYTKNANIECYEKANELLRCGLPISHDPRGCDVILLHPEVARQMQKKELMELLDKCVLTDASTVAYIQSQGIDLGFVTRPMEAQESIHYREVYTEHPVNKYPGRSFKTGFFTNGYGGYEFIEKYPSDGEVIGRYSKEGILCEVSDVIFTTGQGGRWAVVGYGLWKSNISSVQRSRIQDIIDYLKPATLPARIINPIQAVVIPRVSKENNRTVSVSVVNCTIEQQENIKVQIRRPLSETFFVHSQEEVDVEATFEKEENDVIITIPQIKPWSIVTIEAKRKDEKSWEESQ